YAITPSGLLSLNYVVTFVNGTLTVTPAALTVIAANATRSYGAANPALGGNLAGLQNGDAITASYSSPATSSSPLGSYAITPTLSDPTSRLSNYTITVNSGTLSVTAA